MKAIGAQNPLLRSVLTHVAIRQTKKADIHFKKKSTAYTRVLQKLQIVEKANDTTQQVDRMWERLVEIVLFCRTGKHRVPGQILRSFIKSRGEEEQKSLNNAENKKLSTVFGFLDKAYKETELRETRLGKDVIHFYTMVTVLLSSDILSASGGAPDYAGVRDKLISFAKLLNEPKTAARDAYVAPRMKDYLQASQTQTTHPGQRDTRQTKMIEILARL